MNKKARRADQLEPTWALVTQAHNTAFQHLVERLADSLGPCLLISGSPRPPKSHLVRIVEGPAYDRRKLRHRAVSWVRFALFAGATIAREKPPFTLAVTNPPILPLLMWWHKKALGLRYGLLVWDIYPKGLVDVEILSPSHPIVKIWAKLNRYVFADAEFVITISDDMAKVLFSYGAPPDRLWVIPSWADTEAIRPIPKDENAFLKKHKLHNKFVVTYAGNIGAGHSFEGLLQAAKLLSDDDSFVFVFIGSGLGLEEIKRAVTRFHLQNVMLLDHLPDEEFAQAIAGADVSVVTQRPGAEDVALPSKTYTALAAGTAILALTHQQTALGQLVSRNCVGKVVDTDNPEAIAESLREWKSDSTILTAHKSTARKLAERQFSMAVVFSQFRKLLSREIHGDSKNDDSVS